MSDIFATNNEKRSQALTPTERHALTDTLQLDVWNIRREGNTELLWSASRIDPHDESKSYRRMFVDQLFEFPLFLAKTCAALSGVERFPKGMRDGLYDLAHQFAELVKLRKPSGDESGADRSRVLNI